VHESPYLREPGYAERYRDRRFRSGSGARTDQAERAALRALLQRCPPVAGCWLDMPSGAGRLSDELPGPVVQIDRDPAMLQACSGRHRRVCASALSLPLAGPAFAGGLCHRLLQHIATPHERVAILRELARVVHGPLVVSFFDAYSLQHARRLLRCALRRRPPRRHAVSREMFRRELAAAGWRLVAMQPLRRFVSEQTLVLCLPAMPAGGSAGG
jgi:hypothetical protein